MTVQVAWAVIGSDSAGVEGGRTCLSATTHWPLTSDQLLFRFNCRKNLECSIRAAILTEPSGAGLFDSRTTEPRQKTSAANSPFSSTGRKKRISIAVSSARGRTVLRRTPVVLMFCMTASDHSFSPSTRNRRAVPMSYRRARATPLGLTLIARLRFIPSPRVHAGLKYDIRLRSQA
jgi:hypothetical protein